MNYYDEFENKFYNPDDDDAKPGANLNWKKIQRGFKRVEGATAEGYSLEAEGYARGTQNGEPVNEESPYYQNNAKYYADDAGEAAQHADEVLASIPDEYSTLSNKVDVLSDSNFYIESEAGDGYYTNSGSIHSPDSAKQKYTVAFVPVTAGDVLTMEQWSDTRETGWLAIATYGEDKTFNSRVGKNTTFTEGYSKVSVPVTSTNTKFVRFSFYTADVTRTFIHKGAAVGFYKPAVEDFTYTYNTANTNKAEIANIKNEMLIADTTGLKSPLLVPAKPRMIAHRGLMSQAPEDTIPAFELAGQAKMWAIECDVYETTDGYFIISHENDVSRMTDGTGNITEMTYAETQACTIDAGANIDQYTELKMPTLEQCLTVCRLYGCVALIEIKSITHYDEFIDTIKACGMEGSSVVIVPNTAAAVEEIRTYTALPVILVSESIDAERIQRAANYSNVWISALHGNMTAELIALAHTANVPVGEWWNASLTAEWVMQRFTAGLDYITGNNMPI